MEKSKNPILLDKFLIYLIDVKCYSQKTIKQYEIDLLLFFKFLRKYRDINIKIEDFNIFIIGNTKEHEIIDFLIYLNNIRKCGASRRKTCLAAIKCFYKWLFAFSNFKKMPNPASNLPQIQQVKKLPKHLNLEKAKKIIDIFDSNNSKFALRNNTIIFLFLNCGLRISELANINLSDINISNASIKIKGKGNKERICYLNKTALNRLKSYLQVRTTDKIVNISDALFLSLRKNRISTREIGVIVKNAYKLAGLEEYNYTTHTLRHTSATIMHEYANLDIFELKAFLGHSSLSSTEIYTHINNKKVKEAIDKNPLANFSIENIA